MSKGIDLKERYKTYLRLERGLSPNSIDAYLTDVDKLFRFANEEGKPVTEITYDDLRQFIAQLCDIGIHPRSQARILSGIKSFYGFLMLEEYITADPTELIESPKIGLRLPEVVVPAVVGHQIFAVDRSAEPFERVVIGVGDLYVIYLSERDLWKAGKTVYTVEKKLSGTEIPYSDGMHIIFANAEANDGTEIARTMQYFKVSDPMDQSHGALSKRVHYLKCEEGGRQEMCEISEKIYNEGVAEGRIEGRNEGRLEAQKETAITLAERGMSISEISEIIKVSDRVVEEWLSDIPNRKTEH